LSRYIDGLDEKKQASEDVDYSIHPNDRAQKFLERIKEVGK
jgi:hypothetical protein